MPSESKTQGELEAVRITRAENGFVVNVEHAKENKDGFKDYDSKEYTAQSVAQVQAMVSEALAQYEPSKDAASKLFPSSAGQ